METVTALSWGPFSFWAVFAFLTNKPYRFVLQLIISLGKNVQHIFNCKKEKESGPTSYRFSEAKSFLISITRLFPGQLYGVVLYFFTEHRDGYAHSELGHPIYFWFYFVFMNVLWVVIPLALIVDAWRQMSTAQAHTDNTKSHKSKRN